MVVAAPQQHDMANPHGPTTAWVAVEIQNEMAIKGKPLLYSHFSKNLAALAIRRAAGCGPGFEVPLEQPSSLP